MGLLTKVLQLILVVWLLTVVLPTGKSNYFYRATNIMPRINLRQSPNLMQLQFHKHSMFCKTGYYWNKLFQNSSTKITKLCCFGA